MPAQLAGQVAEVAGGPVHHRGHAEATGEVLAVEALHGVGGALKLGVLSHESLWGTDGCSEFGRYCNRNGKRAAVGLWRRGSAFGD